MPANDQSGSGLWRSRFLGGWDPTKALPLTCVNNGEWQILLNAESLPAMSEYKFLIIDRNSGEVVHWEDAPTGCWMQLQHNR